MGESKEFCGGTHVARTGDIAFFLITEEAGVAQGVRRIEAVTGAGALGFVRRLEGELGETGKLLRAGSFEVAARVAKLQAEQREQQKEIENLRRKLASGGGRDLASEARDVGGVRVLATRVDVADAKALREVADQLRDKLRLGRDRPGRRRGRQDRARGDGDARSGGQAQRRQDRRRGREGGRRQGGRPRPTWRRGAGPSRSTSTRRWRACSISFVADPANGVRDRRGGRGRDRRRGAAPPARPARATSWAQVRQPVHDRQGVRRRRARARSGAPPARRPARRASTARRRGPTRRPPASASSSRTRHLVVIDKPSGHLQRPLRAQGDRHRDGPDPRRLASQGQARDRDAALHRAPHRQGHVGPALLRQDAPGRARAAPGLSAPHRRAAPTWPSPRATSARCASSRT